MPGRFLFLMLILAAFGLKAQEPFTREFWLNESGIPVKVNDVARDASGYMWLATDKGLYSFNGSVFVNISDSVNKPVSALGVMDGNLYLGYGDGSIATVNNSVIYPVNVHNRRPSSAITSIHSSMPGVLWVTTEAEGIFLILNGYGLQMTTEEGLADNFIYDAMIAGDEVMLTTDRGINHIRWDKGRPVAEVFTTAQGLPDNIVRVLSPIPNTSLCWAGTQEGGLAIYDDRNETIWQPGMSSAWGWGQVNDILAIDGREAWVATEEGYLLRAILNGDSLEVTPSTFEGRKLKKLLLDKTGNIWCATNHGLLMSTALYADRKDPGAGYQLRSVTAMAFDGDNSLWYTQNSQLYRLKETGAEPPEKILTAPASITSLHRDNSGRLWIGSFGKGLFYYEPSRGLVPVVHIPELKDGHILSITSVGARVWVSSLNGVEELEMRDGSPERVRHHDKLSGTGSDYIYQLYADRKGYIWMATDGAGVCLYDGSRYHTWDTASGLASDVVYTIAADDGGHIWAGALEKGLYCYDGRRWAHMDGRQGLQDMNITALSPGGSGQMIVVNAEGIDQWYPSGGQFRHYNRRLGMGIDSVSTVLNCIANDTAGNVIIPFGQGFIRLKKQRGWQDIRPGVRINTVSIFFNPLKQSRNKFAHDENHISFRFDGINFTNPERLHYRYKLEGYDENWIYTNDENIAFPQLPPGAYKFRVQASLSSAFGSVSEDSYTFEITSPFWQRSWFIILASLALCAAVYGYIRLREQGLRKMSKLQRERMLFEYEHLKSQVNPHFLFNSLNTLVSLIEDDRETAIDYTVHLSDLYRNMLSYRDKDLILLAEEYEIIINYMYIQKSRFGDALHLETDIPAEVLEKKRIVPLALQLLVENAIKHNIVSLSRPLTIYISATEQEITVRNHVQPKMSKEKGAGLGLINIKKRYGLLTVRDTHFGIENDQYIVTLPLL